jgi:signal transduction histidine kinase
VRAVWTGLGLRARLTLSIGALVLIAFGVVFVFVRAEMADESHLIGREEAREHRATITGNATEDHGISPISDAQEEVERTFFIVGGIALVAALIGGYLIAARTASPLRHMAATAEGVRSGDLTPRLREEPAAAPELRALVAAFNRMLDRLDRAFSRQRSFVSDASHELRTPLTAIRGQLEVFAGGADPSAEEVQRVKAVTIAEVERMERLVDELLELAQLDERSEEMETSQVELAALLRELAEADTTGVELGELAGGHITASPELLGRVVRNLLANARRHAGDSGRVILSTTVRNGRVTVSVDDDGPGIPLAERERVFERFHRVDAARGRNSGGSGLGLAISQEIVEAHGGRIWVEDSALGGARAAFELPGFTPEP